MISLAEKAERVTEDWIQGNCRDCGSSNVDFEILSQGKRCRCNICGLRGKTVSE